MVALSNLLTFLSKYLYVKCFLDVNMESEESSKSPESADILVDSAASPEITTAELDAKVRQLLALEGKGLSVIAYSRSGSIHAFSVTEGEKALYQKAYVRLLLSAVKAVLEHCGEELFTDAGRSKWIHMDAMIPTLQASFPRFCEICAPDGVAQWFEDVICQAPAGQGNMSDYFPQAWVLSQMLMSEASDREFEVPPSIAENRSLNFPQLMLEILYEIHLNLVAYTAGKPGMEKLCNPEFTVSDWMREI